MGGVVSGKELKWDVSRNDNGAIPEVFLSLCYTNAYFVLVFVCVRSQLVPELNFVRWHKRGS